jgi:hypothetical protein
MGDAGGGTSNVLTLTPGNQIIAARATYGDIVNQLQFIFDDGTTTPTYGHIAGSNDSKMIGYYSEILSSIHINGVSSFYGSADCVVFGFQFAQSTAATLAAIRALYIKTPHERIAADFANAFPKLGITTALITYDLKVARKTYWDKLKAHAAAIR